jgi:hypothetical protein
MKAVKLHNKVYLAITTGEKKNFSMFVGKLNSNVFLSVKM